MDATSCQIDETFAELCEEVFQAVHSGMQTVVLIFFSGHGLTVEGKNHILGIEREGTRIAKERDTYDKEGVNPNFIK